MASAFASLFKSKKKGSNKENESMSSNIHRGKPISSSMRQQRASQSENNKNGPTNGGVYQGGFDLSVQDEGSSFEEQAQSGHHQQQQHRGKASSVISAATPWSKYKWFQSPYDVVTAPKTKKSSRSCPGGASHPPVPASVASLRHSRHHSPPSSYGSSRPFNSNSHHQQQYPTIHEVYENYAPRPSSNADQAGEIGSMQRQRYKESSNPRSMVSQPSRTSGYGSVRGQSSLVGVSHTVDNNSYNPLRQRIFGGNNPSRSRASCDTKYRHPTSEYGSADPSPTNQFPPIPSVSSTSDVGGRTTNGAEEFENTDYDSDSDGMPTDLVQLCTQQLRRVNGKCKTYKETARRYKSRNLRLQAELQMVNEHLAKEKSKNQLLSSQLLEAKNEMHRLHSYFMQISENVPPTNQLSSRSSHMHHTPLQPINLISGAGEALCSRTDSTSDLLMPLNKLREPEGRKHHNQLRQPPMHSLFSQQFNSLQRTCRRQQEEEEDELITFRKNDFFESDCNEDFDCTEDPRHSKCSTLDSSACKLSPPPNNASKQKEEVVEEDVVNNKHDDGYSTMLQNEAGDKKGGTDHNLSESQVTMNSTRLEEPSANDVLQSGCEEKENNTVQSVNSIKETDSKSRVKHTPPIRSPMTLSPAKSNGFSPVSTLRKSFSETDLSRICLEDEHTNDQKDLLPMEQLENEGLCNTEEDVWDDEDPTRTASKVVRIAKQRPHRYETSQNRQVATNSSLRSSSRNKVANKYCCYSPKRGDYSSSYSSDDDAIRVLAKQLRKRGELVHFKPPQRKSLAVVNCQDKLFRHFGQRERQAIAQFEYLKEMPTDVSGLLSSPDGAQSPN